jgi:hypothetical protein
MDCFGVICLLLETRLALVTATNRCLKGASHILVGSNVALHSDTLVDNHTSQSSSSALIWSYHRSPLHQVSFRFCLNK